MAISLTQLQSMNFGYLSGSDLLQWCNAQFLISAYNSRPSLFDRAVGQAISEVRSKLFNIYDLTEELSLTDVLPPVVTPVITGGVITGVTISQAGSNIIAVPTASVTDTTGSGAALTAVISDSVVDSVEVLAVGRHYRQPPAISFVGGNPTRPATAVATLGAFIPCNGTNNWSWGLGLGNVMGSVVSIVITDPGSGYKSAPTVQIAPVDGFGFGASAVPLMSFGKLTGITVDAGGAAYSAAASIGFSGAYQLADQREPKLVKIISVFAVYNALGSFENYGDKMKDDYKMMCHALIDIRSGQDNLQLYGAKSQIRSSVQLVQDKFKQIG
jgi:hypothetical protein